LVYDDLSCARGQAENLIKLHKTQLVSDRTSTARRLPTRSASSSTAYWHCPSITAAGALAGTREKRERIQKTVKRRTTRSKTFKARRPQPA
jgi:hypothetical protein